MKRYIRPAEDVWEVDDLVFCASEYRNQITSAISSRDISKSLVRVKSSNVWAYNINVRKDGDVKGDVYVQYKNEHGGPGSVYVYYNVPVRTYRKLVSAPSKGHAVWEYLRKPKIPYSKLTGDKRGKLPYAINH